MSNEYAQALMELKGRASHLPSEIGDQWRTPHWLFLALDKLYGPLVVDLFTDGQNSLCPVYYTADDNALTQDWANAIERAMAMREAAYESEYDGVTFYEPPKAFGNPPYSIKRAGRGRKSPHVTGMTHIMEKAAQQHFEGVPSLWVVKSATSESWWPDAVASKIIHIKGRISFEPPEWYKPDALAGEISGAGFGASVVIFNGEDHVQEREEYMTREALMDIGMPLAKITAEERARWIRMWDEI